LEPASGRKFLLLLSVSKPKSWRVILLLDEPGLTLHGTAQDDLLRFFDEQLTPHHQIIYSTHSPFMVPPSKLERVRTVQDQIEQKGTRRITRGTKVSTDVLTRDAGTLFPLQAALGYHISQSLFVGENTLCVEGPSDILYIKILSEALRKQGRKGLDARWTVCPTGGIDKIRSFVSLFSGNALNIAVLSDQAPGEKRKLDDLKRSEVLRSSHFYALGDLLGRPEADIEDIFEPGLYAAMVNGCYDLKGSAELSATKLEAADSSTVRVVKRAEAAFKLMPALPEFSHYAPADWLLRHPKILDAESEDVARALDRAEAIFAKFNALL
jgi:hypothetical protein